jgi:hypothetical protein
VSARARLLQLIIAGSLASAGCGDGCGGKPEAAGDKQAPATPSAPAVPKTAVVEGVVRLAEGAQLPSYRPGQMERRVLEHTQQAPLPEACTPPKTTDRQPVQLVDDGALSGVMLGLSDFARQPARPPMLHEVMIEDCRLTPKLVVAMKGDQLRVRSATDYPFMPAYGDTPVVRTLIRGQTYDVTLDKPGVSALLCGFTAPCGRTDVVVMLHPLTTITDGKGKFRFDNFPADEDITLTAWHPLFQESSVKLHLGAGETKQVELVLTPVPQREPVQTPADGAQPSGAATQPDGKDVKKAAPEAKPAKPAPAPTTTP